MKLDIAELVPNSQLVNEALRFLIRICQPLDFAKKSINLPKTDFIFIIGKIYAIVNK